MLRIGLIVVLLVSLAVSAQVQKRPTESIVIPNRESIVIPNRESKTIAIEPRISIHLPVGDSVSSQLQDLTDEPSRGDLFNRLAPPPPPRPPGAMSTYSLKIKFFRFPADTTLDTVENKPRLNSLFGIDISHYTSKDIHFDQFAGQNVKYVYMKATQGTQSKDDKFKGFWSRAAALPAGRNVHRGAYHFMSAQGDAARQAQVFLAILKENGGLKPTDMPPVVDLEWDVAKDGSDRWAGQSPQAILQKVQTWLDVVEDATGRTPMIYTSTPWWQQRIGLEAAKNSGFSRYAIWIADYSNSSKGVEIPQVPNKTAWAMWQFTNNAHLGESWEGLDASIFKGTERQFYRTFHVAKF